MELLLKIKARLLKNETNRNESELYSELIKDLSKGPITSNKAKQSDFNYYIDIEFAENFALYKIKIDKSLDIFDCNDWNEYVVYLMDKYKDIGVEFFIYLLNYI